LKFKKILKRKIYPTWVSTTRHKGCRIYILYIPKEKWYHFRVLCDSGNRYTYNSLDENIKFNSFKDCCRAVERFMGNLTFT